MSKLNWYSGSCRRVCIIQGEGAVTNEVSVYVFRAADRAGAIRRLLEMAKTEDQEYDNGEGQRVRWALVSIDTVDELGDGRMRDLEVHSKMTQIDPPDASMALDSEFHPERFDPGMSGVMGW